RPGPATRWSPCPSASPPSSCRRRSSSPPSSAAVPLVEKLGGLAGVALFWAAGWGIGELLPVIRRQRPAVRHAYRYLLGLAWVAGALYAGSHLFGLPLRRPAIMALSLLPVVAGALSRWLRRSESKSGSDGPSCSAV